MHAGRITSSLILALSLTSVSVAASQTPVAKAFHELYRINRQETGANQARKAQRLLATYQAGLAGYQSSTWLKSMSTADLRLMFEATYLLEFYVREPRYLTAMRLDLKWLERRSASTHQHAIEYYRALLLQRRFSEAGTFRATHPYMGLPAFPPVISKIPFNSTKPSTLQLSAASGRPVLVRQSLRKIPDIIVISDPLCHFSQHASEAITADSQLGPYFTRHAL